MTRINLPAHVAVVVLLSFLGVVPRSVAAGDVPPSVEPIAGIWPDTPVPEPNLGTVLATSGDRGIVAAGGFSFGDKRVRVLDLSAARAGVVAGLRDLEPDGGTDTRNYGRDLALEGTIAVVSDVEQFGPAWAYVFDIETGEELRRVTFPVCQSGGRVDVAIEGTRVVAQFRCAGSPSTFEVFDAITGVTEANFSLNVELGFGDMVLEGGTLYVAAPFVDAFAGAVHVIDPSTGTVLDVIAPDTEPGERFGSTLAADDGRLVVGSPAWSRPGASFEGRVTMIDLATRSVLHRIERPATLPGAQFGSAVAVRGGVVVIADRGDGDIECVPGGVWRADAATGAVTARLLPTAPDFCDVHGGEVAFGPGTILATEPAHDGDGPRGFFATGLINVYDDGRCGGDVDADGRVGFDDLLAVLANWSDACSVPCEGDVDVDGDVDFGDLLIIVTAWGPCG